MCPSCAERARILRAAQCREGWHLDREPVIDPDPATQDQRAKVTDRAEAQADRDALADEGLDTGELDERIGELDQQITDAGMRGTVLPARPRRHRSTRRRQDAAPLPRRPVSARTVGKTYTAPDGKTFRPSLFVTLTCPSYGRVGEDGAPADPDTYDYTRAARDALHFAALFDRFIQNLRRYTGYDLQYFAAIEPQRRLAPHVHLAIRGTISRAELREVIAATYHQVWWPSTQAVKYDGGCLPVWDEHTGTYLDPDTGEVLPTWDQALDAIGDQDEPLHVARFGARFDAQGVLAGSRDASRCIGYLTKYLTKHLGDCHQADHRRPGRPRRPARRRAAVRAVLADLRELAPLRHPAPQRPARPAPGRLQGQSPPPRVPRLRRAPRPGLPQVVRQDAGRPPRRPADLAHQRARASGNRPAPLHLGTGQARRPGPHAQRATAPARRRRPHPMASRACRGTTTSRRRRRPSFSNWEGSVTTQNPKAAGPSGEDAASPLHGARPRRQMSKGLTLTELLALPLMVDVSTAARALGLSRSTAYELARRGEFPCRVLHVGSSYRVPTAELLRVLGIDLSELSPRFPAA